MEKYYEISGDECDGDYCQSRIKANDKLKYLSNIHPSFSIKTNEEVVLALVEALKELNSTGHNWARFDFDNFSEAVPLIVIWMSKLFNVDMMSEEFENNIDESNFEYSSIEEEIYYALSYNILPGNEISIHTIASVKSYIIMDKQTLF